jgi:hypothetical protein
MLAQVFPLIDPMKTNSTQFTSWCNLWSTFSSRLVVKWVKKSPSLRKSR